MFAQRQKMLILNEKIDNDALFSFVINNGKNIKYNLKGVLEFED